MRKLKLLAQQVYTRRFKTRGHSKRRPVVVGGLIALRDGFGLAAIMSFLVPSLLLIPVTMAREAA